MSDDVKLPKFRNPPLNEVAMGVQFDTLPLLQLHFGAFRDRIADRFPITQIHPSLPPTFETLGDSPFGNIWPFATLPPTVPNPRVWFSGNDATFLVQLQNDRFVFNWRKLDGNVEYPHYEYVRTTFEGLFTLLSDLVAEKGLGAIKPNQCELDYVNMFGNLAAPDHPERILRCWDGADPSWRQPLEDLSFAARYLLHNDAGQAIGRLNAILSTVLMDPSRGQLKLDLIGRGVPFSPNLDGVLAFHDCAHDAIVRCFAAITTPEMHLQWERFQ